MGNIPLIGFLSDRLRTFPSYRYIQEDIVRLMVFAPNSICWDTQRINGLLLNKYEWIKAELRFPDVVYNRCYSNQRPLINRVEAVIGEHKVFNHETRFDKWKTHKLLKNSAVGKYLPQTRLLDYEELSTCLAEKNLHPGFVLKPRWGSQGQGIFWITKEMGMIIANRSDNTPLVTGSDPLQVIEVLREHIPETKYLVQQFIPLATVDNGVFDIRILLQKNGFGHWAVSGGLSRVAMAGHYVTNICGDIRSLDDMLGNDIGLMDRLIELSIETATALEKEGLLGELSVDFGIDWDNQPWIIEVNGKPSKELFASLKDMAMIERVYLRPIEYALYLAKRG